MHDDIGYLLNRVTRRFRLRFAEELHPLGLTPQQAAALLALGSSPDGWLTPGALAGTIDADEATTTGLIQRLERDGWVTVHPNPADGRSRIVRYTPRAEATMPELASISARVGDDLTGALGDEELRQLSRMLQALCGAGHGQPGANKVIC